MEHEPDHDPATDGTTGLPTPPSEVATDDVALPSAPPERRRRWLVVLASAALLLVACGAYASWRLAGSGDTLLTTVPAYADVIATAYLDPDASQKTNLLRMLDAFPEVGDRAELQREIDAVLDEGLADLGLTHADLDWVGSQVLVWVELSDPDVPQVALVLDVDDPDGATDALERVRVAVGGGDDASTDTYGDVEVVRGPEGSWALAGEVLVIGSDEDTVHAALDTISGRLPSIDEDAGFTAATAELPTEVLGLVYVNAEELLDSLPTGVMPPTPGAASYTRVAMTLAAEPDGLVVDAVTMSDTSEMDPEVVARLDTVEPNGALEAVPSGSLVSFSTGDVDVSLETAIDAVIASEPRMGDELGEHGITGPGGLIDALRGDLAFGLWPTGGDLVTEPVGAVFAVGTDDPGAMEAGLDVLFAELPGSSRYACSSDGDCEVHERPIRWTVLEHDGVAVHVAEGADVPIAWAVADDLAFVGLTPEDVAAAIDTSRDGSGIADDPRYQDAVTAVGGDGGQVFFLDVAGVTHTVRDVLGSDAAEFDREAGPWLDPIDLVVAGGRGGASSQHVRVLIRIG